MLPQQPIVLACAGCSNAGALSYDLARAIDAAGAAEMSCLAGVAARKHNFVKQLCGRPVWVVDGCPIECARGACEAVGQPVDTHIRLHQLGVRKNDPAPSPERFQELVDAAVALAANPVRSEAGSDA
jgi:uncharacterized metal-binding protein